MEEGGSGGREDMMVTAGYPFTYDFFLVLERCLCPPSPHLRVCVKTLSRPLGLAMPDEQFHPNIRGEVMSDFGKGKRRREK